MARRYRDIEDCRSKIEKYGDHLDSGTGDGDSRKEGSTRRYKQDVRWFDEWMDEQDIDSITDVSSEDAAQLGYSLSKEFNGTTGRYRWDRIHTFFKWAKRMEFIESNPLEKWNDSKDEDFGLTKSTQQEHELEDEEEYAVSQEDVRVMEENVGSPRLRNQMLIRLLWQTGVRRQEASLLDLGMIDFNEREIEMPGRITKNDKNRVVAYQPNLDGLLRKWLSDGYWSECRGENLDELDEDEKDEQPLLVGERGARLSPEAINEAVRKSADNAGINRRLYADANAPTDENGDRKKNRWLITAHNIRHGIGSYLVHETDMGIYEVSKYLGHESVDTTEEIYVEEDPRAGTDDAKRYGPQ